jgi:surfeit locus 1 family protein
LSAILGAFLGDVSGTMSRKTLVVAAIAALGIAVFAALGTWQVQRRAWKLDLIDRVTQRVHAEPVAAPAAADWPQMRALDHEYRHVRVSGVYLSAAQTLVQAVTERGPGHWLLTPLRQADDSVVWINRGFVPMGWQAGDVVAAASAPVTVTGLLRLTEPGGGFLRHNDAPADRWYSRDVQALTAARGLERAAPFFIDADAGAGAGAGAGANGSAGASPAGPVGGLTVIAFPNNHLVYAITWYTLALMVAAAAVFVIRADRQSRQPRPRRGTPAYAGSAHADPR